MGRRRKLNLSLVGTILCVIGSATTIVAQSNNSLFEPRSQFDPRPRYEVEPATNIEVLTAEEMAREEPRPATRSRGAVRPRTSAATGKPAAALPSHFPSSSRDPYLPDETGSNSAQSITAQPAIATAEKESAKEVDNPPGKNEQVVTGKGDDGKPNFISALIPEKFQDEWQTVLSVWQFPIIKTKDIELSLQVIVGSLLLLWLGYRLANRLSNWLGGTVLRRIGVPPATAAPLQKMSFYALFGVFALFSLQIVGVPMTVFTFFGGALAIGLGFGSQNLMNNFISGLILLVERPIRVGDVIQIDGQAGKVSEIGARSTRITTGSNLEIIIPNSTFLQGNVVNWTLSDDLISSKVTVGVAYGSSAQDVSRLLKQAAEEHPDVLQTPAPGVSFTDFSDHAMLFELAFWIKMSRADRGRIESDLRFKIDELFADHGIVIAYPQRDVHLNLMRPVEVRLTEPQPASREYRASA